MTAASFELYRTVDHSGVSGTGVVATGWEFDDDGTVVLRWLGDNPSTSIWPDIRSMENVHGHNGDTLTRYTNEAQLLSWYERLCKYLTSESRRPVTCGPHPDYPGRIRVVLRDDADFAFWVALLDGSTDASVYEAVNGELERRWATPDGLVWLVHYGSLLPRFVASEAFVVPMDDDEDPTDHVRQGGPGMKPSELLRKGAEEIRRRGWTQESFGSDLDLPETCKVCAIGGLRAALLGDPFKVPGSDVTFSTARSYLVDATGIGSVVNWNDEQGRDVSEVLALFERAAVSAEAKGR